MKKRTLKIMAIAMVFALIFAFAAIPASAVTTYTAVQGGTTTFSKYLIVDSDTNIPNVTFDFSIAPITTGQAAAAGTVAVYAPGSAGVSGTPTISDPAFSSDTTNTPTYDTIQADDNGKLNLDSGKKYAAKTVTVDFSSVSFPEPGIYRYVVTEAAAAASGAYRHDTQNTGGTPLTRYLDVYVTDDGNGTLEVSSYVLHKTDGVVNRNNDSGSADVTNANDPVNDKSASYVNEYDTKDLSFSKKVDGNQASRDKYFKYTVTVTGLNASDVFTVDLAGADALPAENNATTYSNMSNPPSVTGAQLDSGVVFYLQHEQFIKIEGLPTTAQYTVTETAEDYTSNDGNDIVAVAAIGTEGQDGYVRARTYSDTSTGNMSDDHYVGFTNTRDGIIPTGVLLTVAPFAIGLLLFGALAVFFIARKKRREGEEEE